MKRKREEERSRKGRGTDGMRTEGEEKGKWMRRDKGRKGDEKKGKD